MPVTKVADEDDELFATLDPDVVKQSDTLRQLTYRELIVLLYVLALAQHKGKGERRMRMPSLYEMLRLTTSGGVNSRDYDRLNTFILEKADRLKIWEVFEDDEGDYIRFYKEFWNPNFRTRSQGRGIKGYVKADVALLRRLKTRTEVLLALFIEASVNKPGRWKKTLLDDLASDVGLTDRNSTKLRRSLENAFKAVRSAYGQDGKGFGIHFKTLRSSRCAMPVVTISHAEKGKRGRVRLTHEKLSNFQKRMDRVERRKERASGY